MSWYHCPKCPHSRFKSAKHHRRTHTGDDDLVVDLVLCSQDARCTQCQYIKSHPNPSKIRRPMTTYDDANSDIDTLSRLETLSISQQKPQKRPRVANYVPGMMQVAPKAMIGGGRGRRFSHHVPQDANDGSDGDDSVDSAGTGGNNNGAGNGGNGNGGNGNGGNGNERQQTAIEESKDVPQARSQQPQTQWEDEDLLYQQHIKSSRLQEKRHSKEMNKIQHMARMVKLSKTKERLDQQSLENCKRFKQEQKEALKQLRNQVMQQVDEVPSDDDDSSLDWYLETVDRNILELEDKRKKLARRVQEVEQEQEEHQVQNKKSIKCYWQQILRASNMRLFTRGSEEESFWTVKNQQFCDLRLLMEECGAKMAPSRQQFATAIAAEDNNINMRQIYSQPPGTGKTRTIISYIYLRSLRQPDAKVVVRFPNKYLLKQDEKTYKHLKKMLPRSFQLELDYGFKYEFDNSWLQILDEADYHLLDHTNYDKMLDTAIFGITATPIKQETCLEQKFLHLLNFQLFDSCIEPMNSPLGEIQSMSLETFMNPQVRGTRPKLVYVGKSQRAFADVQSCARKRGYAFTVSPFDCKIYRNLQPNYVYAIRNEWARGIDFNADQGIDLLILASSPNNRAYEQLLGRVGRYNQPCFRAIAPNVEKIDRAAELIQASSLQERICTINTVQSAAQDQATEDADLHASSSI